jgi:hypothetical protein
MYRVDVSLSPNHGWPNSLPEEVALIMGIGDVHEPGITVLFAEHEDAKEAFDRLAKLDDRFTVSLTKAKSH